ncbi:MAG TPA: response regulator transcription factor [Candidatus Saccharimonadales bacterium]|nr:response regulator transcription factor [Candidatus Saccharimonadales bacterium]
MKSYPANAPSHLSHQRCVSVVLVEDQKDLCQSWVQIIESFEDFECVCTCASAEEGMRVIPDTRPDVILMDIRLPRMSGIECTSRLKVLRPSTPIVILTVLDDDELIFRALEAGADGYLLKRCKPADLRAALLDVLAGGAPMSSAIARRVVRSFRRPPGNPHNEARLSTREIEVLSLLSRGLSNKEIADQLRLSFETVRTYLRTIYEKLHVHCRTEAVIRYKATRPTAP